MNTTGIVRMAKTGYIAISVLFCLAGLFLMLQPKTSAGLICTGAGILLLVCGAIKLVGYFSKDLYRLAFQFDLAMGAFIAVTGLLFLTRGKETTRYLHPILGGFILEDGLLKLQTAMDAKKFGLEKWWLIGGLAIPACIIGLLLLLPVFEEEAVFMTAAGGGIVLTGILNLCVAVCAVKIKKKEKEQ